MLIRLAKPSDLQSLMKLSALSPPGMTSMPFDLATWEKKLDLVQQSTQAVVRTDQESVYLLVMEDTETGDIIGTAGIVSGVGLTNPFYNYKLSKDVRHSEELDIRVVSNLLNLINDFTGETELISLYLTPENRVKYAGQFLSRCRYVFMNDFPERFSDMVFAEIRGWLDESERSPFWKHLGSKFFNLPFAKADFISAVNGSQFISDLMPRFPIYLELLPEEAVAVIGKPHDDSVPALKLLEREGFRYEKTIDIFDAGPVLQCHRENIASIRNARSCSISEVSKASLEAEDSPICILSNGLLSDYRLILASVKFTDNDDLVISAADAAALSVGQGDKSNSFTNQIENLILKIGRSGWRLNIRFSVFLNQRNLPCRRHRSDTLSDLLSKPASVVLISNAKVWAILQCEELTESQKFTAAIAPKSILD